MPGKREDYITWNEYFMEHAKLSSLRSKDPSTQVGACIVKDNKILSEGYNGSTRGLNDDEIPYNCEGENPNSKYYGDISKIKNTFIVHAELNAILNYRGSHSDFDNSTIFVTLFPCLECTKAIIQSGIKRVVYLNMYRFSDKVEMSKIMFDKANVEYISYSELLKQEKQKVKTK
jgi:dCMP deaminase